MVSFSPVSAQPPASATIRAKLSLNIEQPHTFAVQHTAVSSEDKQRKKSPQGTARYSPFVSYLEMRVRCSRLLADLVPGCSTSNVTEHGAEVTLKMLSRYINNNISPLHNCIRAARHQGTAESSTIKCLSSTKLELSTFQQQTFAKIHSVRRGTLLGPFPC